jgi:hypothetical protein
MAAFSARGKGWRAEATKNILIPLCEGIIAYETGDYGKATNLLWPLRHEIASIGGSHAQRDLFPQIMCDAAVRGNMLCVARSLLSERVLSRGTRRGNWQSYSEVLALLGESEHAAAARKHGEMAPEAGA